MVLCDIDEYVLFDIIIFFFFFFICFFFNDTATTEIYTLSLHDALPILLGWLGDMGSLHFLDTVEQVEGLESVYLLHWA